MPSSFLQVVGSRGPTQINPRNLMLSESSVTGVALGTATAVSICNEDEPSCLRSLHFAVHTFVLKALISSSSKILQLPL